MVSAKVRVSAPLPPPAPSRPHTHIASYPAPAAQLGGIMELTENDLFDDVGLDQGEHAVGVREGGLHFFSCAGRPAAHAFSFFFRLHRDGRGPCPSRSLVITTSSRATHPPHTLYPPIDPHMPRTLPADAASTASSDDDTGAAAAARRAAGLPPLASDSEAEDGGLDDEEEDGAMALRGESVWVWAVRASPERER